MSRIMQDRYSIKDNQEEQLFEYLMHYLNEVHTAQPAHVVGVNRSAGTVDIRLGVMKDVTGHLIDIPVLARVPVVYPSTNEFVMRFPINEGDTGLAVFCEYSIDRWLTSNNGKEIKRAFDTRMHDYSDAVFIPGLKTYSNADEIPEDEVCISYKESEIKLQDGRICISGGNNELIELLVDALDKLNGATGGVAALEAERLRQMICR